jgi:hypothetical protein
MTCLANGNPAKLPRISPNHEAPRRAGTQPPSQQAASSFRPVNSNQNTQTARRTESPERDEWLVLHYYYQHPGENVAPSAPWTAAPFSEVVRAHLFGCCWRDAETAARLYLPLPPLRTLPLAAPINIAACLFRLDTSIVDKI